MSKKLKILIIVIVLVAILGVVLFYNIEQKIISDNYAFDDTIFVKLYSPHFEREYAENYEFDEQNTQSLVEILEPLKGKRVLYSTPYYSFEQNELWISAAYSYVNKKTNGHFVVRIMIGTEAVVFVDGKCYKLKDSSIIYEKMLEALQIAD